MTDSTMATHTHDIDIRYNTNELETITTIPTLAKVITRATPFAMGVGGKLYNYRNGCYRPKGLETVKEAVRHILEMSKKEQSWTRSLAPDVAEYIGAIAPPLVDAPPLDQINCLNGVVCTSESNLLRPHSPKLRSTIQLPITYRPLEDSPGWDEFISSTFPEDSRDLPYDILAWLMVPYTKIQKAILLLGDGANGKSTFLKGVVSFLGANNISTVSLHDLEDDRFATSQLYGKLANICPDLPNKKLSTTSKFKAITGGDPIRAEYKFCDSFTFTPTARLVFSGNEMPVSADTTDGFYRRFIVVPFTQTFAEDPEVANKLDMALSSPKELSGLFNKVLARLPRVLKHGIEITETMRNTTLEFRNLTDPIAIWLEDEYEYTFDINHFVSREDLYNSYKREWHKRRKIAVSPDSFGKAHHKLKGDILKTMETRKRVDGELVRGYQGLRRRDKVYDMLQDMG